MSLSTFAFALKSFRYDDSEMKFVTRAMTTLMNPAAFLPDWTIDGVSEHFRQEDAILTRGPTRSTSTLFLNAYFLIFVATAAMIGAHYLIRRTGREDKAEWLSRVGRYSFPVLTVATNIVLILVFIR